MKKKMILIGFLMVALAFMPACSDDSSLDNAADEMEDAAEEAGDEIEDATD